MSVWEWASSPLQIGRNRRESRYQAEASIRPDSKPRVAHAYQCTAWWALHNVLDGGTINIMNMTAQAESSCSLAGQISVAHRILLLKNSILHVLFSFSAVFKHSIDKVGPGISLHYDQFARSFHPNVGFDIDRRKHRPDISNYHAVYKILVQHMNLRKGTPSQKMVARSIRGLICVGYCWKCLIMGTRYTRSHGASC